MVRMKMMMRTDIPEPWQSVGGHYPTVVVHNLARHSCKKTYYHMPNIISSNISIADISFMLFACNIAKSVFLTIALVLHALDSRPRRVNVVLPGHKHHCHPLREKSFFDNDYT